MNEQGIKDHIADTRMFAYLDGALSQVENSVVEAHLDRCPTCRAQLREIQEFFSVIEDLPDAALQLDLAPVVIASIRSQERSWLSGLWLAVLQVAIAAGVLVYSGPRLLAGNWTAPISVYPSLFERWLDEFFESALVTWTTWSIWADTLLIQAREQLQRPTLSLLPGFEILPWAIALGLFWLLVNGFLLRPGDGSSPTRQNNRTLEHKN
jgi:predicted anti-sigma-YlaC factor YlaD